MKNTSLPLLFSFFLFPFSPLQAAEKIALVIGNGAYKKLSTLEACPRDAALMEKTFRSLGFSVIGGARTDLGKAGIQAALRDFREAVNAETRTAAIYFSGHGIQIDELNYLVPIDFDALYSYEAKEQAVSLNQLTNLLEGTDAKLKLVFFDACRDPGNFLPGEKKSISKSLREPSVTGENLLVCFATKHGLPAFAPEGGEFSLYTGVLAEEIAKPVKLEDALKTTARRVYQDISEKKQLPFTYGSLLDDFFLADKDSVNMAPKPQPQTNLDMLPLSSPSEADFPLNRGEVRKSVVLKLPGGVPITFQYCPPGKFTMGSQKAEEGRNNDEDQVQVRITKGYWLARTECTQAQWRAVMGTDPSEFKGDNLPVENVNWKEVQEFIEKLNRSGELLEGWRWSLPTEAQWEYACRAGTTTAFSFGNNLNSHQANFDLYLEKTSRVGSYEPNDWGLCDMHGNVSEWCAHRYSRSLVGGEDPSPTQPLVADRVVRGGNWRSNTANCRSGSRSWAPTFHSLRHLGFRPALLLSE